MRRRNLELATQLEHLICGSWTRRRNLELATQLEHLVCGSWTRRRNLELATQLEHLVCGSWTRRRNLEPARACLASEIDLDGGDQLRAYGRRERRVKRGLQLDHRQTSIDRRVLDAFHGQP